MGHLFECVFIYELLGQFGSGMQSLIYVFLASLFFFFPVLRVSGQTCAAGSYSWNGAAANCVPCSANALSVAGSTSCTCDPTAKTTVASFDGTTYGTGILFGTAVALSGDGTVMAGLGDISGSNDGSVRVFKNINGVWGPIGTKRNTAGEASYASVSLSYDGTCLAVGAPFAYVGTKSLGIVDIYKYVQGSWSTWGTSPVGIQFSRFGTSVALSGDCSILAVGSIGQEYQDSVSGGKVNVFQYSSGNWIAFGNEISSAVIGQHLGSALSLSVDGKWMAVGSTGTTNVNGKFQVYQLVSGTWGPITTMVGSCSAGTGPSLSLSGNGLTLAYVCGSGPVYVIRYDPVYVAKEYLQFAQGVSNNGYAVSLSAGGNVLVIGDTNYDLSRGTVRVCQLLSGSTWSLIAQMDGTVPIWDGNGRSVAVSRDGTVVASGASRYSSSAVPGLIRIYGCPVPCQPGYFSANGVNPCNPCPAGSYCPLTKTKTPTYCDAGYSSSVVGSTSNTCNQCGAGTYSGSGAGSCSPCPVGTSNPLSGSTSVNACSSCSTTAPNSYSGLGASSCTACPSGSVGKAPYGPGVFDGCSCPVTSFWSGQGASLACVACLNNGKVTGENNAGTQTQVS